MTIEWSYNAMAAVPTPATLRDDLCDYLAGRVRLREGKTGTANLICPVPATFHQKHLRRLLLTYGDGDHGGDASEVRAAIRFIRKGDGHVQTVGNNQEWSTVSSNDDNAPNSGPSGWATHQSNRGFERIGVLDFNKRYYYVQITLKRSNPDIPVRAMGVELIN